MMQATYTNPESGKTIPVHVHAAYLVEGQTFLKVNKGDRPTPMTFGVNAAHTDWVQA